MHHSIDIFSFSSWFWLVAIILLGIITVGLIVYLVNRRKKVSSDSSRSDEEEMAEICCPYLLSERTELRAENKKLKNILGSNYRLR